MSSDEEIEQSTAANSGEIIRGIAKSGRKWKDPESSRFSTLRKTIKRSSWAKKEEARKNIQHVKELSKNRKSERQQAHEEKKEFRKKREEQKKFNERKAELVQVIKNVHKLKRMKKKQLRQIEKRDVIGLNVV